MAGRGAGGRERGSQGSSSSPSWSQESWWTCVVDAVLVRSSHPSSSNDGSLSPFVKLPLSHCFEAQSPGPALHWLKWANQMIFSRSMKIESQAQDLGAESGGKCDGPLFSLPGTPEPLWFLSFLQCIPLIQWAISCLFQRNWPLFLATKEPWLS